jgi:hypothetical protein
VDLHLLEIQLGYLKIQTLQQKYRK